MANYNELRIWQLGMIIVKQIDELISDFPRSGYGQLKDQMSGHFDPYMIVSLFKSFTDS